MDAPERLTVPTCFGCGAMSLPGTCETTCSERKRELVRAAAHDELVAVGEYAHAAAGAFRAVAQRLTKVDAHEDAKAVLRRIQSDARAVMRDHPQQALAFDPSQPLEVAVGWWCPECGGLDAPQPCLAICLWRPVEWVDRSTHERAREHVLDELARERRLRALLRRIVSITPREGWWEQTLTAMRADAAAVLAA